MKFGLSPEVIIQIKSVFKKHDIRQVKIYGSRAKGNYKPGSDIDMAFFDAVTLAELNKVRHDLDELNLPYTFDLCAYHELENLDLKEHIDRVGRDF